MNEKVVIRSSARDLHGLQTGSELLNQAVDAVNGSSKMRQLANHRKDYPPTGYLDNAILVSENGLDLVVAEVLKYDVAQPVTWDDSLLIQKFTNRVSYKQRKHDDKWLTVTVDPNNYLSNKIFKKTLDEIGTQVSGPLTIITDTRKAYDLSNRVIVSLGAYYAVVHPFVTPFLKKIGEKIAEDIAADVYEVSKKKLKSVYEDIRKVLTITKNHEKKSKKPTEIIFEIDGNPKIELHVKSDNADNVVKSLSPAKFAKVHKRIAEFQQHVVIEEAHFSLNDKGQWYFTYLITDDGSMIGTKSIIKKRDQLVKRINASPTKGYSIGADVTYKEFDEED